MTLTSPTSQTLARTPAHTRASARRPYYSGLRGPHLRDYRVLCDGAHTNVAVGGGALHVALYLCFNTQLRLLSILTKNGKDEVLQHDLSSRRNRLKLLLWHQT
ncbi:hypothetical protein J6590_072959 [Homalodisca vitripennis]|nr:hypothetical protein J6590_072959 [Homalodisca vitripennis]